MLRDRVVRVLFAAVLCGVALTAAAPSAGARRSAAADKLLNELKAKTMEAQQFSNALNEDIGLMDKACGSVSRFDTDQASETRAYLNRAVDLAEDGLKRDFDPMFATGGDYQHLEKQLESLANTTSGLQRHYIKQAALYIEDARLHRKTQADYIRRVGVSEKKADCAPFDLEQGVIDVSEYAEAREKDAFGSLNLAAKSPTTTVRKNRPLEFKISVTYTVTYATSETLPLGDSDAPCQTQGTETGMMTQTATFPPITVLGNGKIKAIPEATGTGQITGTWSASGNFFPGNDCSAGSQTYACGGAIVRTSTSAATPTMTLQPSGALADLNITLPTVGEDSFDGCPDGSDQSAYIPIGQGFGALAAHGEQFHVPLDGLALRQHFDTSTIEDGIDHLGPSLPPADCIGDQDYLSACSNIGSRVHDVVNVQSLSSD